MDDPRHRKDQTADRRPRDRKRTQAAKLATQTRRAQRLQKAGRYA